LQLETCFFNAAFNRRGELTHLTGTDNQHHWSQTHRPFFAISYRRYGQSDVNCWLREYCRQKDAERAAWAFWDMGKMILPDGLPSDRSRGKNAEFEVEYRKTAIVVKTRVAMPDEVVKNAGAPKRFEIEYSFSRREPILDITVQWFGKAPNRLPEAIFAEFGTNFSGADHWRLNKFGSAVDPLDVVADGGRMLHAVNDRKSLVITSSLAEMRLDSLDAPLLLPGDGSLWRYTNTPPKLEKGFRFCLYNNQWGTNFPMWYGNDARFRFKLDFHTL
jgi:hypothetical protein